MLYMCKYTSSLNVDMYIYVDRHRYSQSSPPVVCHKNADGLSIQFDSMDICVYTVLVGPTDKAIFLQLDGNFPCVGKIVTHIMLAF